MRQGEILSLLWENVSWNKRTALLPITKNGDTREVPLSKTAYSILSEHLTPQVKGKVFTYSSSGLKSSWRFFIRELGILDFHFHDLRHCAISSLLERGLNTIEVATISGHRSMAMLKRYSHLNARLLVEKLDPKPRAKRERPILRNHLPPYPVIVTKYCRAIRVDFPDFINFSFVGNNEKLVLKEAQAQLLQKLVGMLCDGEIPPPPSTVEAIEIQSVKSRVEMVAPI